MNQQHPQLNGTKSVKLEIVYVRVHLLNEGRLYKMDETKKEVQGSRVRPIWLHVRPNFSRVRLTKIRGRTSATSRSRKEKKVSTTLKASLWFNNRHTLAHIVV